MDLIPPATRRANRWLFIALVIFAIALTITCFMWMRGVVRANGGIVDPQPRKTSLHIFQPEPAHRAVLFCQASRLALPDLC